MCQDDVFGYNNQILLSGELALFLNLNNKLQRKLDDKVPIKINRANDTTGCTQVILRHNRVLLFIQLE